jgi:steroid delta-isomerase-like uncharacterized protein
LEEQNKALILRIHAEVSAGNVDIFDEVLSPEYVRHCQAMPPGFQELHGTKEFKAFVSDFLQAIPDCNDAVEFIIAEGDMVAYVTTTTGTQTGQMGELPASGKEFALTNLVMHRIESGKVAETWISWDNVAMLTQLGLFPPSAAEPIQEPDEGDMAAKYFRLYSDKDGDSHFETMDMEFSPVDFAPPAPPLNISEFGQAESCFLLKAPAGWYGDWHPAPFRQLHFYLSGEVEIETSDGEIGRVGQGDVALVEDTVGNGHRSRVMGSTEVVIAAVKLPSR